MKNIIYTLIALNILMLTTTAKATPHTSAYFTNLYQIALQTDHKTQSATYQADSTQHRIEQAKSALYPNIQLTGGYTKNDYTYNPIYKRPPIEQGIYQASIRINQSIYDPRNYAAIKTEKLKSQATYQKLTITKVELAQTVLTLYLDAIATATRIKLHEKHQALNKSIWNKTQKLYTLRLAGQTDVLQAKVDYDNATIALHKQRANLNLIRTKLNRYTQTPGYPLPDLNSLQQTKIDQRIQTLIQTTKSLTQTPKTNPYLQYAQQNTLISKAQLEQTKTQYWPKLNLTASYTTYDTDTPNVQNSYQDSRSIGINFTLPLYEGGSTTAQQKTGQLLYQAAKQNLADTQQTTQNDWDEAQEKLNNAIELLPYYRQSIDSATLSLNLQQKKFAQGLASVIDLNDATDKLYTVKSHYIDNLTELLKSYIKLLTLNNQLQDLTQIDAIFR